MPKRSICLLSALLLLASAVSAQSSVAGDITGTVIDSSGAIVQSAKITLKSTENGSVQSTLTNSTGDYRFSLLKPGRYIISSSQPGFQSIEQVADAVVGQVATVNLTLTVGQSSQTVLVTENASLLNPEASNNTAFTPAEVALLPSPGGDITNIAFTLPGAVVSMNNENGNFTVNGLPATSNLFTINGENYMDPYFNVNNSGATNLSLGQNETQEVSVITNAYEGQYGTFAGAQVTYVTMSGTNQFHGNAIYWWNGRDLNANDWFNNAYGDPRPFSNANQWAARLGGPIVKNKTFFFIDNEGLRFVIPDVISATIPTPAFANAVLGNIAAKQPNQLATYKQLFNLWDSAPGSANAQALPNSSSCTGLSLSPDSTRPRSIARNSSKLRRAHWPRSGFYPPASITNSATRTRRSTVTGWIKACSPSTTNRSAPRSKHIRDSRTWTIRYQKLTFSGRPPPANLLPASATMCRNSRKIINWRTALFRTTC